MSLSRKFAFSLWPCLAVLVGLWWFENAWLAILLYHSPIVICLAKEPGRFNEVRDGFMRWPSLAGIVVGIVTVPALILALPWIVGMSADETGIVLREKLIQAGLPASAFWFFFVYFVLIHPIVEELGWRSFLNTDSLSPHGLDLMFATYHLLVLSYFFPGSWLLLIVSFAVLAGSGWIWRQMGRKFGGLASVVIFHAAADAGIMVAVWWLAFRENSKDASVGDFLQSISCLVF